MRKCERIARKWALLKLASLGDPLPDNAPYVMVAERCLVNHEKITGRRFVLEGGADPAPLLVAMYRYHG